MILHDLTYVFAFHPHDLSPGNFNVNLAEAKVILQQGASVEKLPLQERAGGNLTGHFLN